jgi:hypothetical protein
LDSEYLTMPDPVRPERRHKPRPANSPEIAALDRKFRFVRTFMLVFGVAVSMAIGFMIYRFMSDRDAQGPRPNLVNNRPPEFLAPIVCDLRAGIDSSGVRAFIRNVGDASASNVVETLTMHLVPEKKVGMSEFDDIPQGDCKTKTSAKPFAKLMESGEETTPVLPARLLKIPPLLSGEAAQLYGTSCFYYSDLSGNQHISCETHHFTVAGGTPVFMCDDTPKTGAFDPTPVASCGN